MIAAKLLDETPILQRLFAEGRLCHAVDLAEREDVAEEVIFHTGDHMRVDTRVSNHFAGNSPKLREGTRLLYGRPMSEGLSIDLSRLRALIVANTGEGKPWTRRKLSLAATGQRNPDLVRDIMRVDKRKPTIEAVSGICGALGVDLSEVVRGALPANEESDWLTIIGAVEAGVWRENTDWSDEDRYEVEVGPTDGEGERYGLVVEGRSMDRTLPPGIVLECVKLIGSGLTPEDGDYVIAERQRGGLYERTVKRLALNANGEYSLIAESSLPEFKSPIPIGKPDDGIFGDDETRVIALVLKAHVILHRSKRRAA